MSAESPQLVVGGAPSSLLFLDPSTGALRFTLDAKILVHSVVQIDDGVVVYTGSNERRNPGDSCPPVMMAKQVGDSWEHTRDFVGHSMSCGIRSLSERRFVTTSEIDCNAIVWRVDDLEDSIRSKVRLSNSVNDVETLETNPDVVFLCGDGGLLKSWNFVQEVTEDLFTPPDSSRMYQRFQKDPELNLLFAAVDEGPVEFHDLRSPHSRVRTLVPETSYEGFAAFLYRKNQNQLLIPAEGVMQVYDVRMERNMLSRFDAQPGRLFGACDIAGLDSFVTMGEDDEGDEPGGSIKCWDDSFALKWTHYVPFDDPSMGACILSSKKE